MFQKTCFGRGEGGAPVHCSCNVHVHGLTPTGGTCPNDFSDPKDQDICTLCALSWKIVVSEWWSVIAVSLNAGVCLIKLAKLYMCTQMRTDAQHGYVWLWLTTAEPLGESHYENWTTTMMGR